MNKIADKATEAVKFLEKNSYWPDSITDESEESILIPDAIRATQMAELEALEWSRTVKPIELEYRIKQLKIIL